MSTLHDLIDRCRSFLTDEEHAVHLELVATIDRLKADFDALEARVRELEAKLRPDPPKAP